MRPSIESARTAAPAYSIAWPCAPSAPMRAMIVSARSLAPKAVAERAVDRDAHALGPLLPERLRHQHMRDFGGADAEGEGAESAMRRGMAVAADDRQSRQRQPLFRRDDMHDALAGIVEPDQANPGAPVLSSNWRSIRASLGIGDAFGAIAGGNVMIGDAEVSARDARRARRAPRPDRKPGTSPHAADAGRSRAASCRPRECVIAWASHSLSIRAAPILTSSWALFAGAAFRRLTRR